MWQRLPMRSQPNEGRNNNVYYILFLGLLESIQIDLYAYGLGSALGSTLYQSLIVGR